ncbi:hypothetical protein AYO44_15220 [Planctomycetaceae bacterium SCGC AG-212-F19]|nr:hypothetical protein AYO44_15220 [Planctomycetaceae bacterium SCGC AG-212-F19]
MRYRAWVLGGFAIIAGLTGVAVADPCVSGLSPGTRPGPYSFVLSTGANRGQSQCFICETADRPAVVIFARTLNDAVGKLTAQVDKQVTANKAADVRAWITFLHNDQAGFDKDLVQWTQKHGLKVLPAGVFEDLDGPPSYKLKREADVTVLLFVKRKVVANFAYRAGELTDEAIGEVMKTFPRIVENKP